MIRRDVRLPDGTAGWMLISQVEHARISVQLAERCRGTFGPQTDEHAAIIPPGMAVVRDEVLAAIRCHDDGWAQWERAPRLDPELGRPLSFMELEAAEALPIWSRSITAAESHGPLAAWMVAGHFLRLLNKGDDMRREPCAIQWQEVMERRRHGWLADWLAADQPIRTPSVADEALQWLWTFDEMSLWFCCTCPNREGDARTAARSTIAGRGTPVEMTLEPTPQQALGTAAANPYRFDEQAIEIVAAGVVLPAACYADGKEFLTEAEHKTAHWRLQSKIA